LKIQYCSDLHLEFPENRNFIKNNPLKALGDILILAGDIMTFKGMELHNDFFDYVSDHFRTTYWIPGNHEYYGFDLAEKSGSFSENIRSNVYLLNNTVVEDEKVRLIFSTLWSKISPGNEWHIERGVNDFHLIKYKGHRLSSVEFNQLHAESFTFLKTKLEKKADIPTVVVTHHVPTLMNYPEQYKNSAINEAFAVELFDLIEPSGAEAWIYGHSHCNTPDFLIGNTRILTNQLGYVKNNEHQTFISDKFIFFDF